MKKTIVLLSFTLVAVSAVAQEANKTEATTKPVTKPATHAVKTAPARELAAEVVAFDAAAKTLTIKGEKANQVLGVDDRAVPALKDVKAGQKLTLLWQETKGQKSIVGVKPETKSEAQAQPKAETKPVPAAQKNPTSNQPSSNRK